MNSTQTITLNLPGSDQSYAVTVGAGLRHQAAGWLMNAVAGSSRNVCVVVDETLVGTHGADVIASFKDAGFDVSEFHMEAGESNKTLATVEHLYQQMLAAKVERQTPIVAVGGGVVGDTVGFAAATFLRGTPFLNIPTTLLSMVDASVGGKTGVNINLADGTLGKNLIGAFHQPRAVMIDVECLSTLPARHMRSGMAECIKHAILADEPMFDSLTSLPQQYADWKPDDLVEFIRKNVAIKATIVEQDEREAGVRMTLNLGHTFAHAIETRPELDLWHGEAVALGLIASAATGQHMGVTTNATVLPRIQNTLDYFGLPTQLDQLPADDALLQSMQKDKKVKDDHIRLVLPRTIGEVVVVDNATAENIAVGWAQLRANE